MLCRVQHYLKNTRSLIKSSISSVISSNAPSEVFAPSSVFKASLSSMPQRPKFPKQFRGKMKSSVSARGSHISFGKFALQALESAWITSRQIEAGRRAVSRNVPRGGKLWVRVFPDKPISAKPSEVRMGRGKGPTKCWVAVVQPGRILYEVDGIAENQARMAIQIAGSKMPIRTRFIQSESHNRV